MYKLPGILNSAGNSSAGILNIVYARNAFIE
jgi:hypothetical protein